MSEESVQIVVTTGVKCKGNHPLILLFDGTSIHAVHNQVALPVKNGSSVFSDIISVQGPVMNAD